MKIKKTVTAKVIEANRSNSQRSSGPHDTKAITHNATKHGLLAKSLRFKTEDEKNEFNCLVRELESEKQPAGRMERALIEEAAVCLWKARSANAWEFQELAKRRRASKTILKNLIERHYGPEELPMLNEWDGSASPARLGWDCRELTVRSGTTSSGQEGSFADRDSKAGHVQVEARLTTSLDTVLRYQAAIKRDLYRALAALRDIRRDRDGEV